MIETAWCVVTGPPSAGKTSVLDALASQGHRVVTETAREHIATLGKSPNEIAANRALQIEIQHAIARRQQEAENGLPTSNVVFLDRALPDSLAYFQRLGIAEADLIRRAKTYRYRQVFCLEGLPLARDGLRYEDDSEARALGEQIQAAYLALGYTPIHIPAFANLPLAEAIERRVTLILEQAN